MKRTATMLAFAACLFASNADAFVAERIVAVVGERPILLSELRHRAVPDLLAGGNGTNEGATLRAVLTRMIEERLVEQAAQRAHLAVTPQDIDRALETKAKDLHVTTDQLVAEAVREGFGAQDYRDEIRRQILEGKLLQLRVAGRVRVTEADARAAYAEWSRAWIANRTIDLRVVAVEDSPGARAMAIVLEAACTKGENLCVEASKQGLSTCRDRVLPLTSLPPAVQSKLPGCAIVEPPYEIDVLQGELVNAPAFESVQLKMMGLAMDDAFLRERGAFIAELRRSTYVDVRLNE